MRSAHLPWYSRSLWLLCALLILSVITERQAQSEPLRVRRNFLGMHNLKGGGVTPFQTGLDWTRTLVGDGFAMEWVTDYAPDAPDHWIYEVMSRGMVPCVRVQQCQGTYPDCGPSVGYCVTVVDQVLQWKVAHPEYADRLVYFQLWNEPGDARDYVPMTDYADFLVAAYNSMHNKLNEYVAAYPELGLEGTIKVMTPGQNDGWDTAFNHNPQAKYSFDVWATHPYPDMTPPWYNIHDGDFPSYWLKCIDSYIQDLDECAKTHQGVPGRRGFPVMITETCYGWFVGDSDIGWPKLTQEARAPFTVDAYFERWYRWPEIIAVHPFLLNNVGWPAFEFVPSWGTQDLEPPWGVDEPSNPYPVYTDLKEARWDVEAQGKLAPARLTPYRDPVGKIAGTVTRADTGAPVPYASIFTDGYEFGHLTLFDGMYEVHDVPVGTYTLSFEKYGYLPASQEITVTEGQTTTANFSVTYTGKTLHLLYHVKDGDGGCDENCSNLSAVDHWQTFVTGPETKYIKYAACHIAGDGITMKFFLTEGGPSGPQVGTPVTAHNPEGAGHQMIGWEWPDGEEPNVQPNTTYWLHFQREDGAPIYCYASNANPYPNCYSSSSSGVDFYACIYGLTQEVNVVTGTIAGTVEDDGGSPVGGATVTRVPGNVSVTTEGNGTYSMENVPVGTYDVTASRLGYSAETVEDRVVNENQTTTVDFTLSIMPTATATPTPAVTPVVANPSFETSFGSQWTMWKGSGGNTDNIERQYEGGNAKDGVWVMAVKGIGTGGKGAYQYIPNGWIDGHNYRLSVWAKNLANSNMNYSIGYKPGNGGSDGASATYGNSVIHPSSWTQATVEFTCSGSAGVTVYLRVVYDGHTERAGFDLVEVTHLGPSGPPPTTPPTSTFTPTFTATDTPPEAATHTFTNTPTNTPTNTKTNTPTDTPTNTPTQEVVTTPVVVNPSFEGTLGSEWTKWTGAGSNQDNNERQYEGGNAASGVWVLAVKGIGTGGKGAYQYIPNGWMAGRNYRLSVWARNLANSNMNYSIGYKLGSGGSDGSTATYGSTVVHPSSWTQATVEFTYTGEAGATIYLRVVNDGQSERAGFDLVEITDLGPSGPAPTPTPTQTPEATPTAAPTPDTTPVVLNPSFETSLGAEWQKWVGSGSNQDNNERHYLGTSAPHGVWVLAVKGFGTGGKGAYQYVADGWIDGHDYRLSVWVKNLSNTNINYSIGYKLENGGSDGSTATYGSTVVHPSSWTQATVEFTYEGSSGATIYLRAVNDGHSERAGFDMVEITDLGPSGPMAEIQSLKKTEIGMVNSVPWWRSRPSPTTGSSAKVAPECWRPLGNLPSGT